MQAVMTMSRAATYVPRTLVNACPSSWITWICYWSAFGWIYSPAVSREMITAGPALWVVAGGLAAFFASVAAIQRYMHLSLKANTFGSPKRLATGGIFKYSRNPIYAAFLIPLASLAYFSPVVSALAILAYMAAMNRLIIPREETVLEQSFGPEYLEYKASAPRWVF